jgi:hypothetical protein
MPNTVTAMRSVPLHMASQAAVCRGVSRQVSAAAGAVLTVAIVSVTLGGLIPSGRAPADLDLAQAAYNRAFQVMALIAVTGVVIAQLLPGRAAGVDAIGSDRARATSGTSRERSGVRSVRTASPEPPH